MTLLTVDQKSGLSTPKNWLLTLLLFCTTATTASAQEAASTSTKAGDFMVYHTVFNSSFLTPQVAEAYGFTRGADKALVNVAVTDTSAGARSFGLPATVTGTARNLMQQQTKLVFQTIEEQNATYYMAPFEFDDQEIMHFDLDVVLPGASRTTRISFTKKLYKD